jgi:hypothetical protein
VTCLVEKFYAVLSSLSEANVDRIRHVVEQEPTEQSYENLKQGLVASHVMSDYEKIDKLMQLEPLNGRKSSDMLVNMERLKLADKDQYFAYMFLQRLPREVRVLLTKEPIDSMRALAEKADTFIVLHQLQTHDMPAPVAAAAAAAVMDEEEPVTAVKGGKKSKHNKRRYSPSDEKKSPLCWLHIRFGDKANRCEQPCAWLAAEN